MKHGLYKEHYQFEWDHRWHISSATNIPIAVTTVLGGAVTVMAQSFPYEHTMRTYAFVAILVIAVVCIVISIGFLFRAIHGYEYSRIPTPKALKGHYDQLLEWHEK